MRRGSALSCWDGLATALGVCLILVVFLLGGRVEAQASPSDQSEAQALFSEASSQYREGNFERTIELLQRAYGLHPEPAILYNLARAYEGLGRRARAADAYERYLEQAADVEDRGAIERRISTLRADAAFQEPAPDLDQQDPTGAEHAPETETSGQQLNPVPWIIASAGVVVMLGAIVPGVIAQARIDEADAAAIQQDADRLQSEAQRLALTSNLMLGIGAAIAVAGAIWVIVDLSSGDEQVALGPGSVVYRRRF